jgi:hypothetical protein
VIRHGKGGAGTRIQQFQAQFLPNLQQTSLPQDTVEV